LQFKKERVDREKIEAKVSESKQNSAPVARLFEKLTLKAATIFSQLRARCKKSEADLVQLEAILEILER
jgi:hypothetical protein